MQSDFHRGMKQAATALRHYLYPQFAPGQISLIHFFHLVASRHDMLKRLRVKYDSAAAISLHLMGQGFFFFMEFIQFFLFSCSSEAQIIRSFGGNTLVLMWFWFNFIFCSLLETFLFVFLSLCSFPETL